MKNVSSFRHARIENRYFIDLYKVDGISDHSDIRELAAHYDGDNASSYMTHGEIAARNDINLIEDPLEDLHF